MVQALTEAVAPTKNLQEIVLGVHFRAPLQLGVMDLADWGQQFSDYPIVQQLQPLPTSNINAPMQFGIEIGGASLPRMLLRSPDSRFSLQLQGDRFAFGWSRIEPIGEPALYPGFDAMFERWTGILSRFEMWTEKRFQTRPPHRLAEVSYVNAAPLEVEGKRKRISEVFSFVQPVGRSLTGFSVAWVEPVYVDQGPLKGTITATVQLAQAPPAIPVLAFNFAGLAEVADGQDCKHIMKDIHGRIREIYQTSIAPDAR